MKFLKIGGAICGAVIAWLAYRHAFTDMFGARGNNAFAFCGVGTTAGLVFSMLPKRGGKDADSDDDSSSDSEPGSSSDLVCGPDFQFDPSGTNDKD
ncbi:hypothetical protein [Burkholderia plantarii]|uniref:hypothetical protein n=1 Tax=Burkholderia plantarii TaxID=41899 RepID=UPI0011DFA9E7|nr:hypothetical protein [Burkholderia plantarii]GLZ23117.1 hypothetical protein Bpla01_66450 [Burkholderia plantarii]